MAALSRTSLLRYCIESKFLQAFLDRSTTKPILSQSRSRSTFRNHYKPEISKVSLCRLISTRQVSRHHSTSSSSGQDELDPNDLIKDFEISHDEFKYVERVLPPPTVPEWKEHSQYPTPSGWFPPNESLQAQQKYLVRRTKNHMLPVYSHTQETWHGMAHYVSVKKIEGDIWALEADLREHILQATGQKTLNTQVHEVGRFIRVRGQHRDSIANFLLEKGN